MMRSKKHITVKTTTQGIDISMFPAQDFGLLSRLILFLVIWSGIGFLLTWNIVKEALTPTVMVDALPGLVMVVVAWLVGTLYVTFWIVNLFSKETLSISGEYIHIGTTIWGRSKSTMYAIRGIHDIRLAPHDHIARGRKLCFEYTAHSPQIKGNFYYARGKLRFNPYGTTIRFGKGIDGADAKRLVDQLFSILTFHCHSVERIIFGVPQALDETPTTTLYNPEATTITFPFVRLKHLILETAHYDFHQVERFITYAVNYLGQQYLKHHVAVHIYGDVENLHPNVLNTLTNLCHSMTTHDERRFVVPIREEYTEVKGL